MNNFAGLIDPMPGPVSSRVFPLLYLTVKRKSSAVKLTIIVVTLLVMRSFLVLLDASRARLKAPTFGAWTFVIQLHFLGL